jgi:hypothetical protein
MCNLNPICHLERNYLKDESASVDENVFVIDNINKMIASPFSCTLKFFHSISERALSL